MSYSEQIMAPHSNLCVCHSILKQTIDCQMIPFTIKGF